jgi:hypothetical protein
MMLTQRAALALALSLAPLTAVADEISDDVAACKGEAEACTLDGRPGTCKASKCSRIDYSGDKPESVERDCVKCVLDAPAKAAVPAKAEVPANTAEPTKAEPVAAEPTKAEPVGAEPAKTAEPAKADAKPPATAETKVEPAKSGCAVDPGPLSLATIPLGVVLVALARRRRR